VLKPKRTRALNRVLREVFPDIQIHEALRGFPNAPLRRLRPIDGKALQSAGDPGSLSLQESWSAEVRRWSEGYLRRTEAPLVQVES